MAFNITDFRAKINAVGLAKSNAFELFITPPASISTSGTGGYNLEIISGLCKTAEIPALNPTTVDVKPYAYGPSEKRASGLEFEVLNTVFMVDEKFRVISFFRDWTNLMVDYRSGNASFIVGYKDNYIGTIEVHVYSGFNEKLKTKYTYYDAYPVTVGNISTSWENNAEVMNLPVGFAYSGVNIEYEQ